MFKYRFILTGRAVRTETSCLIMRPNTSLSSLVFLCHLTLIAVSKNMVIAYKMDFMSQNGFFVQTRESFCKAFQVQGFYFEYKKNRFENTKIIRKLIFFINFFSANTIHLNLSSFSKSNYSNRLCNEVCL